MATKPSETYTWATATNFSSGPASGQPTKVNPPGFPTTTEGLIPDDEIIPEWLNKILNINGQWVTNWIDLGSSAGAADAHIVETDAIGTARAQRVAENQLHFSQRFFRASFVDDYPEWVESLTGSSTAGVPSGKLVLSAGASTGNAATVYTHMPVDTDRGTVIECVAAITSAVTTCNFFIGASDTAGTFPLEDSENHQGVGLIYRAGTDTNWTLAGQDGGSTLVTSASDIAVTEDVFHRFRIEVATDGSAELFIDGVSKATLAAASVGSASQRLISKLAVTDNVTRTAEIESADLWQPSAEI